MSTDETLAYQGLVQLATSDQGRFLLWGRIYRSYPDSPVEVYATPAKITCGDRPNWRVVLTPERPDLPLDEQPPQWPPPFPIPSGPLWEQPYCRIEVTAGGQTECLDRLRLELQPRADAGHERSWEVTLTST